MIIKKLPFKDYVPQDEVELRRFTLILSHRACIRIAEKERAEIKKYLERGRDWEEDCRRARVLWRQYMDKARECRIILLTCPQSVV